MSEVFDETQTRALIDAAQEMIHIWERLSSEKQNALLERFGSKEKALAALVATRLVTPQPG